MPQTSGGRGRGRGRNNRGNGRGGRDNFNHRGKSQNQPGQGSVPQASGDLYDEDGQFNSHLPERFGRGFQRAPENRLAQRNLRVAEASGFDIKLNPRIREYLESQNAINNDPNAEPWLRTTEVASGSEVNLAADAFVDLPANRINRPYKSTAKYIRTQYQLLREDAVSPLRDAVDIFKKSPNMLENKIVNIYEKVHIVGFTFTSNGIAARITFSIARVGKRINWSASRRLVSGTMVALSPMNDNFQEECTIGIVAARPLELLDRSPPEIDIYFNSSEEIQIDPQKSFIMIEAKVGYYEAHRHTLRALQKLSAETFPMSDNITAQSLEVAAPEYLAAWPYKNLSAAFPDDTKSNTSEIDILEAWPEFQAETSLDPTQWESLRQMLTKKFAIIQGPPGTGKTHVSVVALRILVQNRSTDDPPIIVAAQTNHALDQLLQHISGFDPNYIRLGGRSGSIEVKKRALYEIRQRERVPNVPGSQFNTAKRRLDVQHKTFGLILALFDDTDDPISVETLHLMEILSQSQKESLERAAENWVSADSVSVSPIRLWLHNALIPFRTHYDEEAFGFEELEEDLELEQIKETEAEHGVNDEEDIEMLKGPWRAVFDKWTVAEPSAIEYQRAKELLDTVQDLWSDVPQYMRGPVYYVMQQRAKEKALSRFRDAAREYDDILKEIKIGKWEKDAVYLARANIIGLTTTGLSKYRPLISSLQPKIILIEEAAEVIEAPVTVACVESLQHLILVGDHMQLRGHCAVTELEGKPYHLNVSMFERLVGMNMPYARLLKQRRMDPEFRELISSLYPKLEDHPSVVTRIIPRWGTGDLRSYFFTHQWLEAKDDTMSTYNEEEACLVAKFYRYLRQNRVPPDAITVLVFYNGHRKKILKELKKEPITENTYVKVRTVDSYQGEENKIVILSLARSNTEGKMGFLENANRACVALSRAMGGFYIFGRADLVSKNPLWRDVVTKMSRTNRLGETFPLFCDRHQKITRLRYPAEWDEKCPEGGCDKICEERLSCGHLCDRVCHGYPHESMLCQMICGRLLDCGHCCQRTCHEDCFCGCRSFEIATAAAARTRMRSQLKEDTDLNEYRHSQAGYALNPDHGDTQLTDLIANTKNLEADRQPEKSPGSVRAEQGPSDFGFGSRLARGGGAFEPQTNANTSVLKQGPPRLPMYLDLPSDHSEVGSGLSASREAGSATTLGQYQRKSTSYIPYFSSGPAGSHMLEQQRGRETWTSFAEGGVTKDDQRRFESSQSPQKRKSQIKQPSEAQKDLLGLFSDAEFSHNPTAPVLHIAKSPDVENDDEQTDAGTSRQRYVQNYQPAQPIAGETADKLVKQMGSVSLLD